MQKWRMSYPRGSTIAVGVITGIIMGLLTGNLISMVLLGFMFGLIGEAAYKSKNEIL